ncbi:MULTISPECIES: hypothetical protein [Dolichospermum]|uniref:Uncharacterized protein n=1 Tax=Dolichospermum flos-aquae CCAP 1403/13F TaxID=315271 RepID=A0A6H2BUW2_DOLFA|nr:MULTISPECIES: hypothetical protein [Dolichospermum]QJB42820.1 hypothetical protein HGD76_02905 [Dolichospermum flos-aquae CCAP 1403/13F]
MPAWYFCQLFVVSGQWSVGAKHLEDKLSVIAKNSSPNASPVQWSVVPSPQSPVPKLYESRSWYYHG